MKAEDFGKVRAGDTVWVIDGITVRPVVVDKNGRTDVALCGVPPGWKSGQPLPVTCFRMNDVFPSEEAAVLGLWQRLVDNVVSAEGRVAQSVRALMRFKEWLLKENLQLPVEDAA